MKIKQTREKPNATGGGGHAGFQSRVIEAVDNTPLSPREIAVSEDTPVSDWSDEVNN